jgi:hypothetical protein
MKIPSPAKWATKQADHWSSLSSPTRTWIKVGLLLLGAIGALWTIVRCTMRWEDHMTTQRKDARYGRASGIGRWPILLML